MKAPAWITCGIAAVACVTALNAAGPAKKPQAAAVATVSGEAITEDELNALTASRLMRVRTEEYSIRRGSLDEIIAERLLRNEAARRHVTVDELLKAEVESKVTIPAPADLETFYDGVKERFSGMPKEDALKQIVEGMRRQQTAKKKSELVHALRAASRVKVLIDPPRAVVRAEGPSTGAASAPVTIVEFSDFECPFCSRAAETLRKVRQTYGDKVHLVFRDFPLPSHRGAVKAAEAAHCAGEQGKFWEMHDRLYAKGGPQPEAELHKAAADVGLNREVFDTCLASGKFAASLKTSQEEGSRAGVTSTPTFFVNGRMLVGAAPFDAFSAVIDEELERAAESAPVTAGSH
jgi:protein-disulfide isomerase